MHDWHYFKRIISKTLFKPINLVKNSENICEIILFSKISGTGNSPSFFLIFLALGFRKLHGESIGTYAEFFWPLCNYLRGRGWIRNRVIKKKPDEKKN